eukprot:m.191152 g.191152  ORF g.191152 m.191152 type:complete len:188 (+) comp10046_c0_seq9:75-638(+)
MFRSAYTEFQKFYLTRAQRLELLALAERCWETIGGEEAAVVAACTQAYIDCALARAYSVIACALPSPRLADGETLSTACKAMDATIAGLQEALGSCIPSRMVNVNKGFVQSHEHGVRLLERRSIACSRCGSEQNRATYGCTICKDFEVCDGCFFSEFDIRVPAVSVEHCATAAVVLQDFLQTFDVDQ